MKSILFHILKFGFAASIFIYLIMSGKIDFYKISHTFLNSYWMPSLLMMGGLTLVMTAWRWNILLSSQNIHLNFKNTLKLVFIGHFFNIVIPGTVSGDVVKAYYITRNCHSGEEGNQKVKAALSVFMDRFIGLLVLVVITFVAVLLNYSQIQSKPELKILGNMVIMGFGVAFVFCLFFFLKKNNSQNKEKSSFFPSFFQNMIMAFWCYRNSLDKIFWASIITVINFLINITLYYGAVRALGENELYISQYFFLIPLGMFATAIPIAPAGLGIGQGVFLKLFEWTYGRPVTIGADMITLVQMVIVSWALVGLLVYVFSTTPQKSPSLESTSL